MSIISSITNVMFIASLAISSIITGIIVRLLDGDIMQGAKAGAVNYFVSSLLLGMVLGILRFSNGQVIMVLNYLIPTVIIEHFSRIGYVKSLLAAVIASLAGPMVLSYIL